MTEAWKARHDNLNGEIQKLDADRQQALRLAFCRAAEIGDTKILEHLHMAGVDLRSYAEPLERAAENGHMDAIEFMLPLYDRRLWGWQIDDILHAAVKSENTKVLRRILDSVDGKPGSTQQSPKP